MQLVCVTVGRADPVAVAALWNEALGRGGVVAGDGGAMCAPPGGGLYLEFVRVPEPKLTKNRVHLGCGAGDLAELDAMIARLVALGGSVT